MNTRPAVDELTSQSDPAAAYRPHLDGLRAVAVYLVLLFHAGATRFSGGYIGVDVFFVLSGFLVTRLLLRDISREGSIRLGRFYSRRFRRLLPAAFVVLIVTALVYSAIASPAEALDAVRSFKAAFLYSTNWYFLHRATAYFGADIALNPVLHFWSLAVEEQFYLVWPLTLAGAFALTRKMERARQTRTIAIAVAVGALVSAAWALSLRVDNPNHAYYGTDARAYELLVGALIALVPAFVTRAQRFGRAVPVATVASLAALVVLASSSVDLDAIERGILVTIATFTLIVALEAGGGGVVKRLLSTRSMTYLGKISYGTYLWHWLVILVLLKTFHTGPLATVGITFLVATGLASLSFDMMEHPVRVSKRLDRYRGPVIALGLTVSIVSALVLVPAILNHAGSRTVAPVASVTGGQDPVPAGLNWEAVKQENRYAPDCYTPTPKQCVLVHGTGTTVDLMGDSHAQMLLPAMIEIARRKNWTLLSNMFDACPWQDGLYRSTGVAKNACLERKAYWRDVAVPRYKPDVIVAISAPLDREGVKGLHLGGPTGPLATGSDAAERAIEAATDATVARFRKDGRKVVLIEPIPQGPAGYDPLACLSQARSLDQCRFVASVRASRLELHYRALDRADTHVWSLSLDRSICPYLPICDPIVNGKIVWYDLSHLSLAFARTLADPIQNFFTRNGIG